MKYLYERLEDKRFQRLCAALVVSQMQDVEVFPVGQADGGRDVTASKQGVVLQVKFTKDRIRKPVAWLEAAINREADNIRKLVSRGCARYVLMTNIEGSAALDVGDRDKLNAVLERHSEAFGLQMAAMWCSDIDAWVDLAGPDLKLTYVDMLAGSDALVALFQSTHLQANEKRERDFLRDYVGNQWERDKRVKFKQVELRSNLLNDLFIDVTAERLEAPRQAQELLGREDVGGLVGHLLRPGAPPFTLVEGIPGQGKSTAAQYLCQVYRIAFLGRDDLAASGEAVPEVLPPEMRLPIRIDLADYALWISGHDPFGSSAASVSGQAKPRKRTDVETFLVAHFSNTTSGYDLALNVVRDLLDRIATQIVFDGLDEVASPEVRERIVREIDEFVTRRAVARPGNMHVVVTTRPNASGLPEPATERFQRLRLNPLSEQLRKRYLRRWAQVQEIESADLRHLEAVFDDRTAAPHVAQLAKNPMQLALLLHLIRTKGDSLPAERTALYRQYMDLFLDREVEKATQVSTVVKEYRDDIEEASAYVGWYMQGRAEVDSAATRLPKSHIVRVMTSYLAGVGRTAPVDEIFKAMEERVWVLTSKQSGTYEFDVQPIREYVTAQFLHEFAEGLDGQSLPRAEVLAEMLSRAYWANTARFLAGHFPDSQLAELADTLLEALPGIQHARQKRATLWALLSDGAFKKRPRPQQRLAEALGDDLTVALLPTAALEVLTPEFGGEQIATRMRDLISAEPSHPSNLRRGELAAATGSVQENAAWWIDQMRAHIGSDEEAAWLRIGAALGCGKQLAREDAERLCIDSSSAGWLMVAGVELTEGSVSEQRLLSHTLDGSCTWASPNNITEASDLLVAFSPSLLRSLARGGTLGSLSSRSGAMQRLRSRNDAFEAAFRSLRNAKNSKGTTSRWVDTACQLEQIYGGPRWLFLEIAGIALAQDPHEVRTAGAVDSKRPTFGPNMHYGNWVAQSRHHANDADWWSSEFERLGDDLSRASWALALVLAATQEVLLQQLGCLDSTLSAMNRADLKTVLATSSRLGGDRLGRRLVEIDFGADGSPATRLIVAHHSERPSNCFGGSLDILAEVSALPDGLGVAAASASELASIYPSVAHLDVVSKFSTTGGFDLRDVQLDDPAAERILGAADSFPVDWVDRADQHFAVARDQVPLRAFAESEWNLP